MLPIFLLIALISVNLFCAKADDEPSYGIKPEASKDKPIIIWFHNGAELKDNQSLRTALSSGLITHVMIFYMHRDDGWNSKLPVRKAIEIVKKSNAKLIWCRSIWPWYNVKNSRPQDLYDSLYYAKEIKRLRAEAKNMGADYVALDTEPYATSPLKPHLKNAKVKWNRNQIQRVKLAVTKAVATAGKIDYVLPAASLNPNHPYNYLAEFGKMRISEHTYYDNEKRIKLIKYPYEIFGAFLSPIKNNKSNPQKPYFLANEIFEKSHLWSSKKGVLLYMQSKKSLAVAKALTAYSKTLPSYYETGTLKPK